MVVLMKTVDLKSFIVVLLAILIVVPIIYLAFIRPNIYACPNASSLCASSYDCVCESNICKCRYQDEGGEVKNITCNRN